MKMSKIESAIRLALAYYEAFNRRDVAAMLQLLSEDSTFESSAPAPDGEICTGKEAIAQYWQLFFDRFPQIQVDIEDLSGLGRSCIGRWRYRWLDSAGEEKSVRGVDLFHEKDGLIHELYAYQKGS